MFKYDVNAVSPLSATRHTRRQASRLARIQATRARVLAAATDLFVRQGYLPTTMGDVAAQAGVAVQTLYLRFGGKVALLRACFDVAVAGDNEPVAIAERRWVEDMRLEPDLRRALRVLVSNAWAILQRAVPLFTTIQQASSDPEVADYLADLKRQKIEMIGVFAEILRDKTGFNQQVSVERTIDLLYALESEELFDVLCVERGWSREEWEEFVYSTNLQHFL